jgi:hypothetical protein
MAIRILGELLTFARQIEIFEGVVLSIDELEALFTSGISNAKIQSFLQDLRYFFDDAVKATMGYSLLVITASTQTGTVSLREVNYPLYQRLGLEGESRAQLQPILDVDDARAFSNVYIEFEYARARQESTRKE